MEIREGYFQRRDHDFPSVRSGQRHGPEVFSPTQWRQVSLHTPRVMDIYVRVDSASTTGIRSSSQADSSVHL
jgi:hypothetical protein